MKLKISPDADKTAGALFYTVIILAFVAIYLVGYMLLTENEYVTVSRSQVWNAAMVNAEAGVEEAMAMINYGQASSGSLTSWQSLTSANGWQSNASYTNIYPWTVTVSNTVYHMTRNNANGGNNIGAGSYDVYINYSPTSTNGPEIYSIGYANWSRSATLAANAARKIYLQTQSSSTLGNTAIVAYQLSFEGNNVTIDSFDSSSSAHSIWQTTYWLHGANYGTWTNTLSYNSNSVPCRTANAYVGAETNYIDVGNANIYGYIRTSPGGTENVGSQGSVGDLSWVHSGTSGLQTGHFRDDMNQTFTSLSLPLTFTNSVQTNNWLPVTQYTTIAQTNPTGVPTNFWFKVQAGSSGATNIIRIGGVYSNGVLVGAGTLYTNKNNNGWVLPGGDGNTYTYNYVIPNRPEATNNIYYTMDSIGSGNLYVDSAYTVIYATNGMSSPILTINTNADAFIYSGGDITFGTTVNNTACARALTISDILGDPISVTASGNASGVAKLLVPSSTLKFNGGGNNTYDIIGEIVGNNVTFNGHFNLHYDESLGTSSMPSRYVGVGWKEVTSY